MKKSVLTPMGLLAASALALTACGGGDSNGSGDGDAPAKIGWMAMLHSSTTPPPDGLIESELQDYTGVDIQFQWVPDASKEEKINAAIASDSMPELVSLTQVNSSAVRNALASGMFWDVEPYLSDYENLAAIPEETIESARVSGGLYGVPIQKHLARYGVMVRQDWLDNLGLEVPHTLDELRDVARAFTEDDPDGNGKDDTYGFYERAESYTLGFRMISGYFGAGNYFEIDDEEQVVPSYTTDAHRDAVEWFADIYDNGWMNPDFVTLQKQNHIDGFLTDKGGIMIAPLSSAADYYRAASNVNPDTTMKWAIINDMTHGDVPRRILSDTNGGMGGWLAIPKSKVEDEDQLRVILKFINDLLDEKPFELMTIGIEGQHWELDENDAVIRIDEDKFATEVNPFTPVRPSDIVTTYKGVLPEQNEGNEAIAENADYVVLNVAQPLISETYDTKWSMISQNVNDAFNKYVSGHISLDEYDAIIEEQYGLGVDEIIAEFTAEYEKTK